MNSSASTLTLNTPLRRSPEAVGRVVSQPLQQPDGHALAQHPVEILRFNTCGSVDDGKSTRIGRLLYGSKPDYLPGASTELPARICWMHPRPLQRGKKYLLKHTTRTVQAAVTKLENRINISTLEPEPEPAELALNDIGEIRLQTSQPLVFDGYSTNATVAAGLLFPPAEAAKPDYNDFAI